MSAECGQETPSLKDIIDLDLPKLIRHYDGDKMSYEIECDNEILDDLKTAASISRSTLSHGIQAICDLLITVEINCPEDTTRSSRIHALTLIFELTGALKSLESLSWRLERATATKISGQ
jgi:hypothetical protein